MTSPSEVSRLSDGTVQLVGAQRWSVVPHAEGGWPEFTIQLRYLVKTDDPAEGEKAAREFFESTDYRTGSADA